MCCEPWFDGGVRTVDYVIVYASDLEASIAFYRDVLGLPFKLERNGYAEFAMENTKLALYSRLQATDAIGLEFTPGGPGGAVLFLVEDVDEWAERLRDQGVRVLAGPADRPWGHRTLHVADPDGFIVELAQEIERQDR